jgi:hypothetical protein
MTRDDARENLAEALADMCQAYGGKPLGLQAALALVVAAQAQHDRDQHAAWYEATGRLQAQIDAIVRDLDNIQTVCHANFRALGEHAGIIYRPWGPREPHPCGGVE